MRRSRLRPMSSRRRGQLAAMADWRDIVMRRAGWRCEFPGCSRAATEAHHIIPRAVRPDLLVDPANGLAVCAKCHLWIGDNPQRARVLGCHGHAFDDLADLERRRR